MNHVTKDVGLVGQINNILCSFCYVNCKIKIKLVKACCTSFYRAELWNLSHNDIEPICMEWCTGIRRLWQVPNTTHSVLIPGLCESISLLDTYYLRVLKFAHKCIRSESSLVNYIVHRGIMIKLSYMAEMLNSQYCQD